jgi:hypothetical protein
VRDGPRAFRSISAYTGQWPILPNMTVSISIDIDDGAVQRMLTSETGAVHTKVRQITDRVASHSRTLAPSRDGRLHSSIKSTVRTYGNTVVGHVFSELPYSLYLQVGTGIYGPTGVPITPRRSDVLVFEAGGETVFARQVRGVKPRPFMLWALRAESPWPVVDLRP